MVVNQWPLTSRSGELVGKGSTRVDMVQKMCTHACNCNNDNCCNYSMNEEGG
jgi:hypothetical protein